jgi:hypothetical protein
MSDLQKKSIQATKDILEKNLQIYHSDLKDKKVILVYDLDSELSRLVSF